MKWVLRKDESVKVYWTGSRWSNDIVFAKEYNKVDDAKFDLEQKLNLKSRDVKIDRIR